ncbi:MAG TPA: fused response regulator/phosphatase [Acidimicrobiales bacterium]|nr:fused response regulator/phosphatase [Acidimicrobiales bacterium]
MTSGVEPGTATILVVDDAETNRYVVSTWLRRAGYTVVEAATGAAALEAIAGGGVDLVTLDVRLPDMSGLDVCQRIKGTPRTAAVPVLHLSATAVETSDRSEGLRRGADAYLVEPVEPEELLATIGALLRYSAARRRAVRLAGQLRRMHDATLTASAATTPEGLLATAARGASAIFGAGAVVVASVGDRSLVSVATPDGGDQQTACPPEHSAEVAAAVTGGTVAADALPPLPIPIEPDGYVAAALTDRAGMRLGAILVAAAAAPSPEEAAEALLILDQFAHAVAISVENLRAYDLEHRIALTLQRSLLPPSAVPPPGLDVAVRYEAAAAHAEVGGDFYEVLELDDERVLAAVGDVVGHSLQAATVMAELRHALRAYALDGHEPAAVLERLDRILQRFHPTITASVCVVLIDKPGRRATVVNAGHPPPLILGPEGPRFVRDHGPVLGVGLAPPRPVTFDLPAGATILLVTDGLFERRGETIDAGLDRMAQVATSWKGTLDELCESLLADVGPGSGASDDIALLAVRTAPPPL